MITSITLIVAVIASVLIGLAIGLCIGLGIKSEESMTLKDLSKGLDTQFVNLEQKLEVVDDVACILGKGYDMTEQVLAIKPFTDLYTEAVKREMQLIQDGFMSESHILREIALLHELGHLLGYPVQDIERDARNRASEVKVIVMGQTKVSDLLR